MWKREAIGWDWCNILKLMGCVFPLPALVSQSIVTLTCESITLMSWSDFLKLHNNMPTNKRTCLFINIFLEIATSPWCDPEVTSYGWQSARWSGVKNICIGYRANAADVVVGILALVSTQPTFESKQFSVWVCCGDVLAFMHNGGLSVC